MTDERIDALIRRLDVSSDPDPSFARATYAALRPRARAARVSDTSRVGRLQRDLRLVLSGAVWPATPRWAGAAGFVVLLILAAMAAIAIVGALNRVQPIQNGPLLVSIGGELQAIDTLSGSIRTIPLGGDEAHGVSRSPDGRFVTFWTVAGGRSRVYVVGVDGEDRRELASSMELAWTNSIDTWSSDSRYLATGAILLDGDSRSERIVIVDVATGAATAVTPPEISAFSPLWSPDNQWIAFSEVAGAVHSLAIIRTDASHMRTVSGDLTGVGGPDTWSPDGTWIYFDSYPHVYRTNVPGGFNEQLTSPDLKAAAPASSPDGTQIAFIVSRSDRQGWDVYVAQSDGTGAHRLLEHAENYGWSADGRYILAQWTPTDQPGGLAVVTPDGSEFRVVLPFDTDCRSGETCTDGIGWGQPRP
jgi:dipeptidyl aminopeptidase/acylaminoacyl peptidase